MEALQDASVRTTTTSRDISKHLPKDLEGYWHKIFDEMDLDLSFSAGAFIGHCEEGIRSRYAYQSHLRPLPLSFT
jgi:hypothetical protein